MSTRRIAALAAIALTFGLLAGSGSVVAQESDSIRAADTYDVVGCRSIYVEDSGVYKMGLPRWCRNGRCEIFFEWGGANMGAYAPGLGWDINFIQYPSETDNAWVSGPVLSFAGTTLAGGYGHNGDRNYEPILGPYQSPDGSYLMLWDDSSTERKVNSVSFELQHDDENNREIDFAKLFICRG